MAPVLILSSLTCLPFFIEIYDSTFENNYFENSKIAKSQITRFCSQIPFLGLFKKLRKKRKNPILAKIPFWPRNLSKLQKVQNPILSRSHFIVKPLYLVEQNRNSMFSFWKVDNFYNFEFQWSLVGRLLTGRFRYKTSSGESSALITGRNNFIEIWEVLF